MQPAFPPARAALACLLMTSALVAPAGFAAAQGIGATCVMTGEACAISFTGATSTMRTAAPAGRAAPVATSISPSPRWSAERRPASRAA